MEENGRRVGRGEEEREDVRNEIEREGVRLGRKKEVRIRNRVEIGDYGGRERAQRCERLRKESREHANNRKGERKRLRERGIH